MSWHFARQFGYDQLYVGKLNPRLGCMGGLTDGARAWRYFIAGCTGARFCMPNRTLTLLITLSFCQWYSTSNTRPPTYKVNSFEITLIAARLKGKAVEQQKEKRV